MVDLKEHRIESAKQKIGETRALLPKIGDSVGAFRWHTWMANACDILEAEVVLSEGSTDDTIRLVEAAPPLGVPQIWFDPVYFYYNAPIDRDVLARAYQIKGDLDKAILEYERLISHEPSPRDRLLVRPIYHYRLAKLCEQKGRPKDALAQYQKFLTIMSEAAIYQTEIADAKERVARLKI